MKFTPLLETLKVLDISDAEYFGPNYKDYISNSRLSLINPEQEGSVETYFEGLGKHSLFTDSLYFGSAVHAFVLQPDDFYLCDSVDRPTAKAGFMADELYRKDGHAPTDEAIIKASDKINYYKGKMDSKRIDELRTKCNNYWRNRALFEHSYKDEKELIYLDEKSRDKLDLCLKSVKNNKKIQSLLKPDWILKEPVVGLEQTILLDVLAEDEGISEILHLKAKLDSFTIDFDNNTVVLNDLKTTGHYTTEFPNSWEKYHYYRQAGMYGWLLTLVATHIYGMENPKLKGNFMLVSTVPSYYSDVFEVTKKEFLRGFNEFRTLLTLVAENVSRYREKSSV